MRHDLRELQEADVIEIKKIHGISYAKIKKYGVKFVLKKKGSSEVKSVSYGYTALKRSAFINELILSFSLKGSTVEEMVEYYMNHTTFLNRDKQNAGILSRYIEYGGIDKDGSNAVVAEMLYLETVAQQQIQNLTTPKAGKVQINRHFSMNNMQSRSIYISSIRPEHHRINIVLLDLNDSYNATKLASVLEEIHLYLTILFPDFRTRFVVVSADIEGKEYMEKQLLKMRPMLQVKRIDGAFDVAALNVDIRKKIFNGVRILV